MKQFLLIISIFVMSCARQPFLDSAEVKVLSKDMPTCKESAAESVRGTDLALVDVGVTSNKMAVYIIFANDSGDGLLIHHVAPGYDWTREPAFKKSEFKGACKTEDGKYFLIYEMKIKSAKQGFGI